MYFTSIMFLLFCFQYIEGGLFNLRFNKTPDTILELDVNKYLGNWYQIYGDNSGVGLIGCHDKSLDKFLKK